MSLKKKRHKYNLVMKKKILKVSYCSHPDQHGLSINTSIQCLFTFDFMYTAAICNRSPLEGARYSPIYFTPLVPLKLSYKRLSAFFWKMHSFSVWFRRVHSFSDNIGTASLLYIAKSESGSTLVESLFTCIIPL